MNPQWITSPRRKGMRHVLHCGHFSDAGVFVPGSFAATLCGQSSLFIPASGAEPQCGRCLKRWQKQIASEKGAKAA